MSVADTIAQVRDLECAVASTLAQVLDLNQAVTRAADRAERGKIKWRRWSRQNHERELLSYCDRQRRVLDRRPAGRGPIEVPLWVPQTRATTRLACLKKMHGADVPGCLYRELVRDVSSGDLYRARNGSDWPEAFGPMTEDDRPNVWLRTRGETQTISLGNTQIAVEQADIGTAALDPIDANRLEPLERQAQGLFRADLLERAIWHLHDMSLPASSSTGCETLLAERLLSSGARVPILNEGAQAKSWEKDIFIEEWLRSGGCVREACRTIVRAAGEPPDSGRSVNERIDDEEKAFRKRLTKRSGVERDTTEPHLRKLEALLMLDVSVKEVVHSAIALAPHLRVAECANTRRQDKIKLLEERISQATACSVGAGLAAARDIEGLRAERDRLVDLDQWKILTNLLVSDNLTDQVLGANATEAGNLIDRMLLDGAAGRG